jgi:hypothetical protein
VRTVSHTVPRQNFAHRCTMELVCPGKVPDRVARLISSNQLGLRLLGEVNLALPRGLVDAVRQ